MQERTYSAREDRALIAAMFDEGVMDLVAFEVLEDSPAAMTLEVSPGRAVVAGDDQVSPPQNSYLVEGYGTHTTATFSAPTVNPRIDLICLQVRDTDAGGATGDDAVIAVVTGSEAASPTTPTLPDTAIPLASVYLTVGMSSITQSSVTDLRVPAGRIDTAGVMQLYSGPSTLVPSGWLLCDGSAVSRTTYPRLNALYSAQSYPFGNGDGSTTFNVPDVTDRVVYASGSTKSSVGATSGSTTRTLTTANLPSHRHTITHTHTLNGHSHSWSGSVTGQGAHSHTVSIVTDSPGNHYHTQQGTTGTDAHSHTPFVSNYVFVVQDPNSGTGSVAVNSGTTSYRNATNYSQTGSDTHSHSISGSTTYNGAHTHLVSGVTSTQANHTHPVSGIVGPNSDATSAASTGYSGYEGSGTAVNIEQPYIVINGWIVRT